MKKLKLSIAFLLNAVLAVYFSAGTLRACDRTELFLDSVVVGAGFVDIYVQMNVGAGLTGTSKGAGGDTQTFAFAFFSGTTISPISFTSSLTSDSTGGYYPGADQGPALGANFVIGYSDTGTPYACISSTGTCGNVHTDIKKVNFRVDLMPDSLRLMGIEGAGNPYAGCYPDADMLIDFTSLPVRWAGFEAKVAENQIALDWTTAIETNNDRFLIQRSGDATDFETIAEVDAAGNTGGFTTYKYFDRNPLDGTNFYKIVQVDRDGKSSTSEVQSVEFNFENVLFWAAMGPNPVKNSVDLSFHSGTSRTLTLQVIDVQGKLVRQKEVTALQGLNEISVDLSGEAAGFYYLRLAGGQNKIDKKILKL